MGTGEQIAESTRGCAEADFEKHKTGENIGKTEIQKSHQESIVESREEDKGNTKKEVTSQIEQDKATTNTERNLKRG